MRRRLTALATMTALAGLASPVLASPALASPTPVTADLAKAEAKAAATVRAMTVEEKTVLTHGIMAIQMGMFASKLPDGAVPGAGFVPGIPRLGVPSLRETDASLGVAWLMGMRKDGATPLPSGLAMASTWNPVLLRQGGAMIGGEARAKGFNVLLAGGANIMRDPRNGRTFEYLAEDPLLTGTLVGAAISGIQSVGIISTIKHFAVNSQETARNFVDSRISESAARESDLLAFQIGIEQGQPGAVMCAYNVVNGAHACDSDWLLNTVLKRDWRYKGFVMSDWGAVPSLSAATNGLDQQSGAQLDPKVFLGKPLAEAAAKDAKLAARVDDMNKRILTAIYAAGIDTNPANPGGTIDFAANGQVALETAKQGIVLLRNQGNILPLAASAKNIAIIGGHADSGVISGGGSSQSMGPEGPGIAIPNTGDGAMAMFAQQSYHRSQPLRFIKARAKEANVTFTNGDYIADAVAKAKKADVAIVFATKWATEGEDHADLTLPNGQDALIAAVAEANPHTIVVLETGNPIAMPWLNKTAAVMEAWYAGARGGEAIAAVLFGDTNPSGHLPVTFPASTAQLPRAEIDGYADFASSMFATKPKGVAAPSANYDIEGSDVGYRWFARKGEKALFPFGYGLSYTSFATTALTVKGLKASFTVKNTGQREGATVAQLYLATRKGEVKQRLVGYARVALAAGASQAVSLTIDPRLLADWQDGGWSIPAGEYGFALGEDAERLGAKVVVKMAGKTWKD